MEDINELQTESFEFYKKRFAAQYCPFSSSSLFIHLVEEIGEVGRQVFNKETKMRGSVDRDNFEEELGQVLIELLILIKMEGFDAGVIARKKLEELKEKYGN